MDCIWPIMYLTDHHVYVLSLPIIHDIWPTFSDRPTDRVTDHLVYDQAIVFCEVFHQHRPFPSCIKYDWAIDRPPHPIMYILTDRPTDWPSSVWYISMLILSAHLYISVLPTRPTCWCQVHIDMGPPVFNIELYRWAHLLISGIYFMPSLPYYTYQNQ